MSQQQKKTPQEVYQAFRQVLTQMPPEARQIYQHLPERWEDLSEGDRILVQNMAWRLHLIQSEFELEQQ